VTARHARQGMRRTVAKNDEGTRTRKTNLHYTPPQTKKILRRKHHTGDRYKNSIPYCKCRTDTVAIAASIRKSRLRI
jgi:hypothetical protein